MGKNKLLRCRAMLGAAVVSAAVTVTASAGRATITDSVLYNGTDGSGGAFTVTQVDPYIGELGGPGGGANSFASFCIERGELLSFSSTYYTKIDTAAVGGGGGAVAGKDELSSQAALLYATFRAGGSFGGTIGTIDAGNTDEASGLQYALWRLEDETDASYTGLVASAVPIAQALVSWANTYAVDGNLYGTRVLQLWDTPNFTGNHQDLLTIVPTPTASFAGMTLLGGLGVLGFMKKRRDSNDLV